MARPKQIIELHEQLGTQEKRAVNRLVRALASGVQKAELRSICRSISRNTTSKPIPSKSAYILYYKARYPVLRAKFPEASLGTIAKVVGLEWQELGQKGQAEYYEKARNVSVTPV